MVFRTPAFLVTLVIFLASAGYVQACQREVLLSKVLREPAIFNNSELIVRGFISVEAGIPRFYTSVKAAKELNRADMIDLAPKTPDIDKQLKKYNAVKCLLISGKFRRYHGYFIGFGNFISKTGVIEVSDMKLCP